MAAKRNGHQAQRPPSAGLKALNSRVAATLANISAVYELLEFLDAQRRAVFIFFLLISVKP